MTVSGIQCFLYKLMALSCFFLSFSDSCVVWRTSLRNQAISPFPPTSFHRAMIRTSNGLNSHTVFITLGQLSQSVNRFSYPEEAVGYDACTCELKTTMVSITFMLAFSLSSLPESYDPNCNHDSTEVRPQRIIYVHNTRTTFACGMLD